MTPTREELLKAAERLALTSDYGEGRGEVDVADALLGARALMALATAETVSFACKSFGAVHTTLDKAEVCGDPLHVPLITRPDLSEPKP